MKLLPLGRAAWRGFAGVVCLGAMAATQGCATQTEEELATSTPKVIATTHADVQQALRVFPDARVIGSRKGGVPFFIRGTLGRVAKPASDVREANEQAELKTALRAMAPVFRLTGEQLELKRVRVDEQGHRHLRYQQVESGLPVIGGELIVHMDEKGLIYAANGSARGGTASNPKATVSAEAARAVALERVHASGESVQDAPRLVYFRAEGAEALELAWEVRVVGEGTGLPVDELVYVHAHRGTVLDVHSQVPTSLNREVCSSNNGTTLPGVLRREEGEAAINDAIVDDNYTRLFRAYNCYNRYFGRDSYDNAGMRVRSTVHYGASFNNAGWSYGANQAYFGSGDGSQYSPLGSDPDIVVHEFTHALTHKESGLVYSNESGALNEALSDIFAAFCSSELGGVWEMNSRVWQYAESSFTPGIATDAARYLDDPADDGSSKDYYPDRYTGADDYGGVHWNSGIANLAFKLLATGGTHPRAKTIINVAGIGVERAGRIFYKANIDFFTSSTTFGEAKTYTEQAARALGYDEATVQSVGDAWLAVGVGDGIVSHVESISANGGIEGWAFDKHSPSASIALHYYIDGPTGSGAPLYTGSTPLYRGDVNAAYSISGNHGFALSIPAQYYNGAPHTVYFYGIDEEEFFNPLLTEQTFTFAGAEGHVEAVGSTVSGWALDVNSKATSIGVHYYIGGPAGSGAPGFATTANLYRSDVNSVFGATGNHGFSFTIPSQFHDGYSHSLYVYAIDAQGLHNPLLDGKAYYFTLGTPPDPTECAAGKYYCDCSGTCVTITMCNHICDN
jgi:Zn-dependent metalloprotease